MKFDQFMKTFERFEAFPHQCMQLWIARVKSFYKDTEGGVDDAVDDEWPEYSSKALYTLFKEIEKRHDSDIAIRDIFLDRTGPEPLLKILLKSHGKDKVAIVLFTQSCWMDFVFEIGKERFSTGSPDFIDDPELKWLPGFMDIVSRVLHRGQEDDDYHARVFKEG